MQECCLRILCLQYYALDPVAAGLTRESETARLLSLRFRIPLGAWLPCGCCVAIYKSLRQADQSSRGVIPTMCVCV
jgi:hypothetical protein